MSDNLPHAGVWARLGTSPLHGVGVFAIMPIPEGTDVFSNDFGKIVWVAASEVRASASSEQQRLYHDFAIQRGSLLGCPANFNQLSVGWYVNEPVNPMEANLVISENFAMIAKRNIAAGEELTISYATFSG